ncbi:hypothetical protein [Mycobacterium sp. Root135]|uniref:hypothetical protein n=1 Tax=Mycobacterium sp. Root135 TaxID=1736457 RepID=UPI0009EAC389|nr:hypothetical protein [Mycobacterium sp. Root135]
MDDNATQVIIDTMTVGSYAEVELQDASDTWRTGAVFLLRKVARASGSVSLNGWVTTVVRGQKAVISCGPSAAGEFDGAYTEALNAANQGLDYLSVTGQADCAIRDAPDDCIVWWLDAALGGVVMRCRAVQSLGVVFSATAEVRDANGNLRPSPPPPTPLADDAFRFVRMSRSSDDLFDAYRNLFLAFESLLSDIRPRKRVPIPQPRLRWCLIRKPDTAVNMKWETEHDWFMASLDQADVLVSLDGLTPPGVTNHKKWIYRWMYGAERSALMHAKRGQNYLLPHGATDRAALIESLGRLSDYVSHLIEKHLHVRRMSSYLSSYAVEQMAKAVLPQFPLVVSDDDGPVNPEAENLISPHATVVRLHSATPRVDAEDPQLWRIVAHGDAADLAALPTIRRFGQMRPDGTGTCEVLSELVGPLVLGGTVVRLEIERGLRHVNPTGPPRQFSS